MKLIAETATHHQGELEFMKQLISAINNQTRADIIKLHLTLNLDEYMTKDHPLYKDSQKWLFEEAQWKKIIDLSLSVNTELLLLFNDIKAIEFGMLFKPSHVEIHSTCLNDIHLLEALKLNLDRDTRIVLGIGGTSLYEIENAINILQNPNIVLMFGFQNFPTKYKDVNFGKMRRIMKLFPEFRFGYADHSAWDDPNNVLITLLGAALGMDYVEKHVTIAYGEERIDWSAAISLDMFNELREKLDLLEDCNSDGLLEMNQGERLYSVYGPMKKAACLARDAAKGDILSKDMLIFKRTAQKTDLSQVEAIQHIGNCFSRDLKAGAILNRIDFDQKK